MATLLLVHAHPDDEAIATGGVMLRAKQQGHRVVLITATRGEMGEIYNMDEASVRPRLGEVRTEELRQACELLGVDRQEFLGYRDSDMAGRAGNDDPDCFHRALLPEAAERVSAIMRQEQPEVVVTYTPDGTYGHPDHMKAHQATVAAVELVTSEGLAPAKLYFHAIPHSLMLQFEERLREAGSAPEEATVRFPGIPDELITTVVDVRDLVAEKRAAFERHVSQMDPNSPLASMQGHILEAALGTEYFIRARGESGEEPERDLFAGLG
ncbi:MAG: PIG-L family deacetylase [Candidatus Dormibacteraeota bacterium]|uniref:PIG-L family deacetylase n=1 Tax=Candidatus Dormiibacter inghamiae TaxID=3127013 RepID=A0A934NBM2_9BACT|nr:PIG-L family deacetylase [Candidatus Dormibacteraeota bacterium]MBJ7605644.1 PIG-L family deacetylase [Candidatus Dormibacteraeota bacterium]